jgi:uncharacterized protein YukE
VSGDAFNDARADWNLLVERINTSIGAAILPAATAFVNIMVESVDRALDQSGMSATEFEAAVSNAFGAVVDVSALVLQAIGVLVQGFAELFTGKWTQEATGLISAIGLVGTNVTNLGQAVALFNGQSGLAGMFERLRAGFVETMRLSTAVAVAGRESERVLVTLGQSMARIGEEMKGRGAEALAAVREQIRQTAESMRNSLGTVNEGLGGVTDSVEEFGRQIDFSDERLQSLVPRIQSFTLPLARLREGGIEAADSFDNLNQTFLEMDPAMRRATVASAETTQRMAQLRTGADHVAESTTEVGLAFDLAGEFVSAFGSELGVLGTILNAAINIVSQYASAVEAAGQAAGNAAKQQAIMNSAATAAATGGMLAAISVGMALKQRYDELEAQAMAVAEEIAGMNEELKEQFGSFTEAQKAAERYGLELEEVNTRFLRISAGMQRRVGYRNDTDEDRLRRFREQLDDLTDRVELAREAAERYGLTWSDMPNVEDRLRAAMTAAKDLEIVFRTLVQSGFDVSAVARGMSDDINAWLNQALRAGIAIPEQMRPMLEALILAGELTEENARLLLGMAESGVPSLNEITAAAERYGITLESLGSKVQQLQIDETAQQLIDDWNILSAATDDMGVVFAGMGEQVQQLVNDAIRYGAELPAAMRPMLQAFIDAGQLVDENGNKLTDLSQLNFAEDLTEQVDRLIEKLDELISAIAGVPPAMGGIGRTATTAASSAADAVEALNEEVTTLPEGWDSTTDAVEMTKQELFDAGRIGAEAAEAIEEASAGARYEVIQVDEAAGDLAETLRNSNYGDPFDAIVDGARSAQEAVEDLEDAVNGVSYGRSPGGLKEWSPMLTQAALTAAVASDRMVSDYDRIARAVNRVTFGSGTFDAGLSTVGTVSPGFGSAGVSGDTTTLNELRAIRRALGNQQPDVIVVPLGPGESWESFEDRLSQRLPRRVIQSSNLRNAWQRAINGGA